MTAAQYTTTGPAPRTAHLPSNHPFLQLMARLYTRVPATHAPMHATGPAKYITVHEPLTAGHAARHWHGTATYAAPLIGADDMSRVGAADIDTGGELAVCKVLDECTRHGVPAVAFLMNGKDHQGGHVCTLLDTPGKPETLRAKMRTITQAAGVKAELYPSKANLRLPFGYHTRNKTRGTMLLPDGTRYHLDNPTERDAALTAWLALPLATLDGVPVTHEPAQPLLDVPSVNQDRLSACWAHTDRMIRANGIPDCFTNPNVPGWRVLRGTLTPTKDDGSGDPDTSEMRYIGIKSLIVHGRTLEECIVIGMECYAFADTRRTGKQDAHIYTDIVNRCYPKALQELLDEGRKITPHPYKFGTTRAIAPYIVPTPVRRGRKRAGTAARLLSFYQEHKELRPFGEHAMLPLSRRAAAKEFGVCVRTLDKLEHELKAAGSIARDTAHDRQYSFVVLLGRGATIHAESPAEPVQQFQDATPELLITTPQTACDSAPIEEHSGLAPRPAVPRPPSAGLDAAPGAVSGASVPPGAAAPAVPSDDLDAWLEPEQLSALPEVPRPRRRRIAFDALTPPEQLVERKRQLGKAQRKAQYALAIGHTSQARAITKHIRALRAQIAALEAQLAAAVMPESPPPSLFAWLDTPAGVAQEPRVPSADVLRWRAALEARIADSETADHALETEAMSFANSFMWESARARIAQMQDRQWARQLSAVVADMLYRVGLPNCASSA